MLIHKSFLHCVQKLSQSLQRAFCTHLQTIWCLTGILANILLKQNSSGWKRLLYGETKAASVSTGPKRYVTVPRGTLQFWKQFLYTGLSHGSFGSCQILGGGVSLQEVGH